MLRSAGRGERQPNDEARARGVARGGPRAAGRFDDGLDDREPESRVSPGLDGPVGAVEAVEQASQVLGRDGQSLVVDLSDDRSTVPPAGRAPQPRLRRVAGTLVNEV